MVNHPYLTETLAREHATDLHRQANAARRGRALYRCAATGTPGARLKRVHLPLIARGVAHLENQAR